MIYMARSSSSLTLRWCTWSADGTSSSRRIRLPAFCCPEMLHWPTSYWRPKDGNRFTQMKSLSRWCEIPRSLKDPRHRSRPGRDRNHQLTFAETLAMIRSTAFEGSLLAEGAQVFKQWESESTCSAEEQWWGPSS